MRRALLLIPVFLLAACGEEPAAEFPRLSGSLDREAAAHLTTRIVPPPVPAPESEPDRMLAVLRREVEKATGAGFDRFGSEAFRAAMDELRAYVARDEWREEEAGRIRETLSGLLANPPRPREAWWDVSLRKQRDLRERLVADLGDEDALVAWRTLRAHLDPDAPDLDGLRRAATESKNRTLATAAAEILLAAERLPAVDEGRKRDLEAVILALAVLAHRREVGEWPEDLESVRPEAVPASPLGMRWELDTDPMTRKPAIFLRGGRRFGAAQGNPKGFHAAGPEESLFRFEE